MSWIVFVAAQLSQMRLPGDASIDTAELQALQMAFHLIKRQQQGIYNIELLFI